MDNLEIDSDGTKRWFDGNGNVHRTDGPAAIYVDGTKSWYQHGLRHRDDGPAVEFASGHNAWWQHGSVHRDNGPAIIHADGTKEWWLNNRCLPFDEWLDKVDMSTEDKVMMKLKYG
jgi:hypothetical protein|tara:strand:- start:532 stop:879 length:348 start_codon:yes stop_codon:yes gene_type:complete